jgi:hypothetical protein
MTQLPAKIGVTGISRLQCAELQKDFKSQPLDIVGEPLGPGRQGEPATVMALAIVSASALTALAIWLLRTHDYESFTHEIVTEDTQRRRTTEKIVYKKTSSKAPEKEVIKAIGEATGADFEQLFTLEQSGGD